MSRLGFLMLSHTLNNFEIQRSFQNEPKWCLFKSWFTLNEDESCISNLDEYKSMRNLG